MALPVAPSATPAASAANGEGRSRELARPRKVLVIEDNEDVAGTLMDWLESTGHRAWIARSGQSGVALCQQVRPEVVLCDLGLPGMDGIEVCRSIRGLAIDEQPLMIALTGWGREGDKTKTREAGFDHHLVKPVALDKLDTLLRNTVH